MLSSNENDGFESDLRKLIPFTRRFIYNGIISNSVRKKTDTNV